MNKKNSEIFSELEPLSLDMSSLLSEEDRSKLKKIHIDTEYVMERVLGDDYIEPDNEQNENDFFNDKFFKKSIRDGHLDDETEKEIKHFPLEIKSKCYDAIEYNKVLYIRLEDFDINDTSLLDDELKRTRRLQRLHKIKKRRALKNKSQKNI